MPFDIFLFIDYSEGNYVKFSFISISVLISSFRFMPSVIK